MSQVERTENGGLHVAEETNPQLECSQSVGMVASQTIQNASGSPNSSYAIGSLAMFWFVQRVGVP